MQWWYLWNQPSKKYLQWHHNALAWIGFKSCKNRLPLRISIISTETTLSCQEPWSHKLSGWWPVIFQWVWVLGFIPWHTGMKIAGCWEMTQFSTHQFSTVFYTGHGIIFIPKVTGCCNIGWIVDLQWQIHRTIRNIWEITTGGADRMGAWIFLLISLWQPGCLWISCH